MKVAYTFLPLLRRYQGRLINIGSESGRTPCPMKAAVCVTITIAITLTISIPIPSRTNVCSIAVPNSASMVFRCLYEMNFVVKACPCLSLNQAILRHRLSTKRKYLFANRRTGSPRSLWCRIKLIRRTKPCWGSAIRWWRTSSRNRFRQPQPPMSVLPMPSCEMSPHLPYHHSLDLSLTLFFFLDLHDLNLHTVRRGMPCFMWHSAPSPQSYRLSSPHIRSIASSLRSDACVGSVSQCLSVSLSVCVSVCQCVSLSQCVYLCQCVCVYIVFQYPSDTIHSCQIMERVPHTA